MFRTFATCTLGCKVNQYETDAMEQMLMRAGYEKVDFKDTADIYLINTCSVTNMADKKSRQMIHRAKKKNPEGIVVAAGCYIQAQADQKAELDEHIDLIQDLVYELHGKLLRFLEGGADCDDFTHLELIGLCIPKKLSPTEAYIAETMIMILKHLEEDTDKVKLFNHITEECNRLESLLSWIRNIQENTFRCLLWKKYSKH